MRARKGPYIGKRLKALRERQGLTRQEFAAKIGYSFDQVGRWERDVNVVPRRRLPFLAQALGVTEAELSPPEPQPSKSGKSLEGASWQTILKQLTPAQREALLVVARSMAKDG